MFKRLKNRLRYIQEFARDFGGKQAAIYFIQRIYFSITKSKQLFVFFTRYALYPLKCRQNTSDLAVYRQIFIEREYSCLDEMSNVDLVIDCGANVGFSSAYFLSKFPKAYAIAIEPDPGNFKMMEQNLAPYKDRVRLMQVAIWSHPTSLVLSELDYRDRKEWSRQVRESKQGEVPDIQAMDIGTILKESGRDRISILKIDIEGAEAVVFSAGYDTWINRVDSIVIELHDDSSFGKCSDIFFTAVSKAEFDISSCGELIVCKVRT